MCRVLICLPHEQLDRFRFFRVPVNVFGVQCKINRNGINVIGYDRNSESTGMLNFKSTPDWLYFYSEFFPLC